ncbi:hypothetical protein [Succiniclasticum ruminis]|uniref:Uncharacterized protein n=1 Tax=Succiniclasticum ruminis DSM 9236 TaxID=1123323 RepID=A0A1I2DRR7_9FIRM|nr:hypothetical protein [Succiniclasticum ruminis]SFE83177.1 hypothetical protein SAMN05216245_1233 [Succiniclasticum ruminis DSM 9236]
MLMDLAGADWNMMAGYKLNSCGAVSLEHHFFITRVVERILFCCVGVAE